MGPPASIFSLILVEISTALRVTFRQPSTPRAPIYRPICGAILRTASSIPLPRRFLIYTLTSDTLTPAELYDAASTVLAQKLSQVEGVGEVSVSGGSLPAVRVELIPSALNKYGIGLEDVRAALGSANAHSPKGGIDVRNQRYQIYANDQAKRAVDYKSIIVAYRNGGAPVRLTDVGEVINSVENVRTLGLSNGKPAVMMIVYRQSGANIIQMVDRVKALMPQLRVSVSPAINLDLAVDRSRTIRASLRDVEITLVIAVALVRFSWYSRSCAMRARHWFRSRPSRSL